MYSPRSRCEGRGVVHEWDTSAFRSGPKDLSRDRFRQSAQLTSSSIQDIKSIALDPRKQGLC